MTKEELIKRLEESAIAIYEDEGSYDYMFKAIANEVKSSDLVEVIRCKDCKFCHTPEPRKWAKRDEHGVFTGEYDLIQLPSYCVHYSDEFCEEVDPDKDYCSHAERKEGRKAMNDLIDRQLAIDYFVTNVGFDDENGYPIEDSDELRKIWTEYFDGIPCAQPEIIRCKDCRHNGSFDTDCPINWKGKEYCSFAERRKADGSN